MKRPLDEKLRAWWSHRQGLDGRLVGARPAEVLEQTGWARSVGGVGPYLTLFARGGASREAADEAVARLEIHELPAARGCTYVVPASDFALALKAGEAFGGGEMKVASKLGVTGKEIDRLCDAVLNSLSKGPLDPDEIRGATGKASGGVSGHMPGACRGKEERLDYHSPACPRQAPGMWPDTPPVEERVSRPSALPLHAVAAGSAGEIQVVRRRSADGAGPALFFLDWTRNRRRVSVVFGAERQSGQGRNRTAQA